MKKILSTCLSLCALITLQKNALAFGVNKAAGTALPMTSPGNTTWYIDSRNGNDSADGKSPATAWASLAKVNSTVFSGGDKILFNSSGVWTGALRPQGSGSPGKPIVIGKYGDPPTRPIIHGNGAPWAVYLSNQQYWEITNLEVTNSANPEQGWRCGILVENIDKGKLTHIYIRNNYIHDVLGNKRKGQSPGITVNTLLGAGVHSWFDSVKIEDNIVRSINGTAIVTYTEWTKRKMLKNATSDVDYKPYTHVEIRRNYIENVGGDGIVPVGSASTIVEYNLVNGAHLDLDEYFAGLWPWAGDNNVFQYNEVYNVKTTLDGQAYDCDNGCNGTIFQYNYSHDNEGGFMLICSDIDSANMNSIVRYNISQNDKTRLFQLSGSSYNTRVYNNTFYLPARSTTEPIHANPWGRLLPANISFTNNIFYLTSAGRWVGWRNNITAPRRFDNNIIYGAHTAGEPTGSNNLTSDPLLVNPGGGGNGSLMNGVIQRGNVDAYMLRSTSPARNAGKLISNNGGRDYWGNAVSATVAPNIGAYNGAVVGARIATANTAAVLDKETAGKNYAYPLPVTSRGKVNFVYHAREATGHAQFTMYNAAGQLILTQKLGLMKGSNTVMVNLPKVSAGQYVAILSEGASSQKYTIVVVE